MREKEKFAYLPDDVEFSGLLVPSMILFSIHFSRNYDYVFRLFPHSLTDN